MSLDRLDAQAFSLLKRMGLSDVQIGYLTGSGERECACSPQALGVVPRVQDGRHLRRRVPLAPRHTTTKPMMRMRTRPFPRRVTRAS